MEKFDLDEGHWVTIGGRRIFIRDGESVSSAMKRSGKFKSAKKKVDYDKRPQSDVDKENERNNKAVEKIEKGKKDFDPNDFEKWRKEVDPNYEMDDDRARLRYESYKDTNVRKEEHYAGEELYSDDPNRFGDKLRQYNEKMTKGQEESAKRVQERYDKESSIKSQQNDIEKASGMKINKSFETDLYGNGKEDRFELEDGRFVAHTKEAFGKKEDTWSVQNFENGSLKTKKFDSYDDMINHLGGSNKSSSSIQSQQSDIERASGLKVKQSFGTDKFGTGKADRFQLEDGRYIEHSKESLGSKDDTWTINKVEKGSIKSEKFDSYDDMIKNLGGSNESSSSNKYAEYYKKENLGTPSNYRKGDKIEFNDGYYNTIKGSIVREATDQEKKYQINSNLKGYVVRDENGFEHIVADTRIKGRGETNKAYKSAYEDYKKKHPNTKLSFGQFVDMSEGK